ncbi:hypothetical protein DXG01_006249 [Tephrocybe rancida]|nr:hypothetical protein DXG01_006249 [Tephrocybe rancida]
MLPLSSTTNANNNNERLTALPDTTLSSSSLTTSTSSTSSSTLSALEKEVLTAPSNTIGSLPPLPTSLDLLDMTSGQLLPPPLSDIHPSGSTVPSQSKRKGITPLPSPPSSPPGHSHTSHKPSAKRWKLNPFLDLEADEDLQDDADILDETEGEDEFDNFIDDCEVASGGRPPMFRLPGEEDKNLSGSFMCSGTVLLNVTIDNNDKEIFPDEDQYLDNKYPMMAAAISHKALALHNNMEQWRLLLEHAYERAHSNHCRPH